MDDNLRIIYQNVADTATVTASTTAGGLVASNLLTEEKTEVWRSTATSATITATWTAAQLVSGVVIPYCNLTSTATIRIRGYTNAGDSVAVFDSGTILAAPYAPIGLWNWGVEALGVNAFNYGGGTYARAWITGVTAPSSVKQVVIDIVDTSNTAGYIEAARLVIGNYWQAVRNADYGASAMVVDTTTQQRNDAGGQMVDIGTKHRKVTMTLSNLDQTERARVWEILWGNGLSRPVLVSLFPDATDTRLEQTHQIWGRLVTSPAMTIATYRMYATTLEIEEI